MTHTGPSPYSQEGSDDHVWRRPDTEDQPEPAGTTTPATDPVPPYTGPPRTTPVPANWRLPTIVQAPAPHTLPVQSDAALDEAERAERTVTYGVGMVAGAIILLLLFVLCGRALF